MARSALMAFGCLGLLAAGHTACADDAPRPQAAYVDTATVKTWLAEGRPITFLDVREADEFAAGHLPGARNIPHDQVASIANELPHDQPIVVYCIHSAHRAPEAAKTLRGLGFANATVLEGGIVAWQAGGMGTRPGVLPQAPPILPVRSRCQYKTAPYPSTTADASGTGVADAAVADTRGAPSP